MRSSLILRRPALSQLATECSTFKLIDSINNDVAERVESQTDSNSYEDQIIIEKSVQKNHILPFFNKISIIKSHDSALKFKKYLPGITLAHHYPNRLLSPKESNRLPEYVYVTTYDNLDEIYGKSFIKSVKRSESVPILYRLIGRNCITLCINGSPPLSDMSTASNWISQLRKHKILEDISLNIFCNQPSQIWTRWLMTKFSDSLARCALGYGNYIANLSRMSWENEVKLFLYRPQLISLLLTDKNGLIRWHSVGTPTNEALGILSKCVNKLKNEAVKKISIDSVTDILLGRLTIAMTSLFNRITIFKCRNIMRQTESLGHCTHFSTETVNSSSQKISKNNLQPLQNQLYSIPQGEYRNWLNQMLLILHSKNYASFWSIEKLKLLEFSVSTFKISSLVRNNYFNQLLHHLDKTKGSLYPRGIAKYIDICKVISSNEDNTPPDEDKYPVDYFAMLDSEIRSLHFQLSPTLSQYENKTKLIKMIVPILENKTKGKFYAFGSCETGFWVKGSDVDGCLVIPGCDTRSQWLQKLRLIKRSLISVEGISSIRIIHATVPIAKIFNEENVNVCDISINNTVALENTLFVKVINKIDHRTSQLGRIIKHWASCRKINNRAQGTMSSYTLLLMLFYFLQNRNPPILPKYVDIKRDHAKEYVVQESPSHETVDAEEPEIEDLDDVEEEHPKEPSTEDDLIGNIKNPPFLDNNPDILEKNPYLGSNTESLGELLYNFFIFYGDSQFEEGRTIDLYYNTVEPNNKEVLVVRCPLTGKNVNPFSPKIWQGIYGEFRRMKQLFESQNCLPIMCEAVSDPPLKREVKDKKAKRKEMKRLAEEIESLTI